MSWRFLSQVFPSLGVEESKEAASHLSFLYTGLPKSPHVIISHVFQLFYQRFCSPLKCMQCSRCGYTNAKYSTRITSAVCLSVLYSVFAPQNACWGTLLAHAELLSPQVPFCWAAFQPLVSQSVPVSGAAPFQVQYPTFSVVEGMISDQCEMPEILQMGRLTSCTQIKLLEYWLSIEYSILYRSIYIDSIYIGYSWIFILLFWKMPPQWPPPLE